MPKMQMVFPHSLKKKKALKRIKKLFRELKEQYGDQIKNPREDWSGNTGTFSFSIKGFSVSGELAVKKNKVTLQGNLPFAALPLKKKIKGVIKKRATELLE